MRRAPLVALLLSSSLASQRGFSVDHVALTRDEREITVHIATVEPDQLTLVVSEKPKPLTDLISCEDGVGINGGFYDTEGDPLGLVITGGKAHHLKTRNGGSGIVLSQNGVVEVRHRDDVDDTQGLDWAVQSIDRIVDGGKNLVANTDGALDARSAVGVRDDGEVLLVTVYEKSAIVKSTKKSTRLGRKSTTTGISLHELAEIMIDYGSVAALNLDGGYSTAFFEPTHRVVGHRPTINALVACPRP